MPRVAAGSGVAMIACVAALMCAVAATAAPVVVDVPVVDLGERVGKISGYGDVLAWSEYDADDATFSLVVKRGTRAPKRLRIATRSRPFDVDVGPDRRGRPALVYSRCRRDPKQPDPRGLYAYFGLPRYPGGSRCDIYMYSLAAGREGRIRSVSTRGADEFMPSIWRGKVAFVRQYSHARPLRAYRNLRDGTHSRRLRAARLGDALSMDLRGRRLAYSSVYYSARLPEFCERLDVEPLNPTSYRTFVSVVEPRRRSRLVAAACNNDSRQAKLAGPVWSGSTLIYGVTSGRDYEAGKLVARSARGTQRTIATYADSDNVTSYVAANDNGIYGARGGPGRRAHISRLTDPP